jgi:hypothetical protein
MKRDLIKLINRYNKLKNNCDILLASVDQFIGQFASPAIIMCLSGFNHEKCALENILKSFVRNERATAGLISQLKDLKEALAENEFKHLPEDVYNALVFIQASVDDVLELYNNIVKDSVNAEEMEYPLRYEYLTELARVILFECEFDLDKTLTTIEKLQESQVKTAEMPTGKIDQYIQLYHNIYDFRVKVGYCHVSRDKDYLYSEMSALLRKLSAKDPDALQLLKFRLIDMNYEEKEVGMADKCIVAKAHTWSVISFWSRAQLKHNKQFSAVVEEIQSKRF